MQNRCHIARVRRLAFVVAVACAGASLGLAASQPTSLVMPAWAALVRSCAQLAATARREHVHWKVFCPLVVPRVSYPSLAYAGGNPSQGDLRAGYGIGATSDSGRGNGYGHWTFEAGTRRDLLRGLFDINAVGKPSAAVNGPKPVHLVGWNAQLYRVAPGTSGYANHVAVIWTIRDASYLVTVHRWRSDDQATTQALAMARSLLRQQGR